MSASPNCDADNGEGGGEGALGVMTAGRSSGRLESELENVCRELSLVEAKVAELLEQQSSLRARRDQLSGEIRARKKRCVLSQCDWAEDNFEWSKPMAELLRDTFGLNSWRTNQKEIINATLSRRDVFVVMRTGGGKSLCYQLPALLKGGITVVVSPLLSLIEDQMRYLNDLVPGSAAMLSAGMDKSETANVYRRMRGEKVEGDAEGSRLVMVLVTPEKVVKSKMFMAALDKTAQSGRLSRVVIDEAHCCSQWGHDFRPEYCKLGILKRQFGHVPILAVTATCTDFIRDDVLAHNAA